MRNKKAVTYHWLVILLGTAAVVAAALLMYFKFGFGLGTAATVAAAGIAAVFTAGAIILWQRRNKLVVPKYPREKRVNFTIRYISVIDLVIAVLAVAFIFYK